VASHPIVHVEIPVKDLEAGSAFYRELFGWSIQSHPEFNYATFQAEGGPGGGFPTMEGDDSMFSGGPLVYVGTDDIDASLAKAESLGGSTVVPKTEIPGIGWFGVFRDPVGNRIALFTGA
jgi:predicted enzyme related to lactoylglutathione lyase